MHESEDEFDAVQTEKDEIENEGEDGEKFKLMNTNVQNVLFFKSKINDPVKYVTDILDNIIETKQQKTRFLMRLVPIEATCKAYEEKIVEATKKLLKKHFNEDTKPTWSVVFKSRCNQEFTKDKAIKIIGDLVKNICPD